MERAFYFAVFEGIQPGVYSLWSEFEAQIKGFDGYRYDIYLTEAAALRAFNKYCLKVGKHELIQEDAQRYFVVFEGRTPGVYSRWCKVEEQIRGFNGHRYCVFSKRIEAYRAFEAYNQNAGLRGSISARPPEGVQTHEDIDDSVFEELFDVMEENNYFRD